MPGSATSTRTARYEQRMRAAGFVRKHVWVPEEQAQRLEEVAAEMREHYRPDRVKTLDEALHRLRASRAELEREGVRHVAIFGSFARGDDRPDSDIDILVGLDPDAKVGLFGYGRLANAFDQILGRPADLVHGGSLKKAFEREIQRDAVHAF
ncbi:MAG: nucleotidyltransferase family protein [Geminicoccaceae bacterium]